MTGDMQEVARYALPIQCGGHIARVVIEEPHSANPEHGSPGSQVMFWILRGEGVGGGRSSGSYQGNNAHLCQGGPLEKSPGRQPGGALKR